MARVTVGFFHSINMKQIDLSGLLEGAVASSTGSRFEVDYGGGNTTIFLGRGLKYDSSDFLRSGTISSYSLMFAGQPAISFEDIKVSASSIASAAKTKGKADDWKIFEKVLGGNDIVTGGGGPDHLYGFAGHDKMSSGGGDDRLLGGRGNDYIKGGVGYDRLYGENGNDRLYGGLYADKLYGGAGSDTFVFRSVSDSSVAQAGRDTIYDFSQKERDRIDLKGIDADTTSAGDQAFTFIGTDSFHNTAGELRYRMKGNDTLLQADVDGDGKTDMLIRIDAVVSLKVSDFIL